MDDLLNEKHAFAQRLKNAERPMFIVGAGSVQGENGAHIQHKVQELCQKFGAEYNYLHNKASQVAALDLGYHGSGSERLDNCKLIFNLGSDEKIVKKYEGQKVVYIGSHGDSGAKEADIILPAAAYTEKHGTFINTEGRAQQARPAVHPPGAARVDWQILRALSEIYSEIQDTDAIGSEF